MSKIRGNSNHFLTDPQGFNHVELQEYLNCCLDPLTRLSDYGHGEFTTPPLEKAAPYRAAAILVPLLRLKFE